MTPETVMTLGSQAIQVALMLSAPMLLTGLAVGLLVSIFQAATQLNEATLSFIPKLVAIFIMLLVAGSWMIELMLDFIRRLFESIPSIIG